MVAKHAISVVVLVFDGEHVLAVKRRAEPYKDRYALPNGFLGKDESLQDAARRILAKESGIDVLKAQFVAVYDESETITAAFVATLWRSMRSDREVMESVKKGAAWLTKDDQVLAYNHSYILDELFQFAAASKRAVIHDRMPSERRLDA